MKSFCWAWRKDMDGPVCVRQMFYQRVAGTCEQRSPFPKEGVVLLGTFSFSDIAVSFQVSAGSIASTGLNVGDEVLTIGEIDTTHLTHAQAQQIVKTSGNLLQLHISKWVTRVLLNSFFFFVFSCIEFVKKSKNRSTESSLLPGPDNLVAFGPWFPKLERFNTCDPNYTRRRWIPPSTRVE